ncbi:putative NADH2 dehydrogenase 40K chain [Clavulina sp. PMI_390]|nr:putative NADH2 dehydrogenase 40K chain [Clavulina sp. PMI_390]
MLRTNAVRLARTKTASVSTSRTYADLTILPETRKPVISYGPSGRSAVSGHVATVFGCTGFLGRYLVHKLAKAGTQVIIPYREEDEKRHLKVSGDLGQIVSLDWDIRDEDRIAECVRHSDVVYNLVGRDYTTKNFNYEDVHVAGARRIAEISKTNGVSRFVHVSHLNASLESPSEFYRAKALGEQAVREVFPEANIVRPASYYGHEDKFLNSMAFWPIVWKLNNGDTVVRPVHVLDVAQALSNFTSLPAVGQTYNLPGPRSYTYNDIMDMISSLTYNPQPTVPTIPKSLMLAASKVAQLAWWPLVSPDEIERRYLNDSDVKGDWEALGVVPEELENVAITYVRRYRNSTNYARPVKLPSKEGGSSSYHTVD